MTIVPDSSFFMVDPCTSPSRCGASSCKNPHYPFYSQELEAWSLVELMVEKKKNGYGELKERKWCMEWINGGVYELMDEWMIWERRRCIFIEKFGL